MKAVPYATFVNRPGRKKSSAFPVHAEKAAAIANPKKPVNICCSDWRRKRRHTTKTAPVASAAMSAGVKTRPPNAKTVMNTTVGAPVSIMPFHPPMARSRISPSARMSATD